MTILGIETSCDETSAAVLRDGTLLSNIVSSQMVHQKYGGVVPELASRAHQLLIVPVVTEALQVAGVSKGDPDAVAVTYGPGLMGALLVGLNFAKALAYGLNIPLIGVNHMQAHIYSNFIDDPRPQYPFLCLIVSGGHTQLVLVRELLQHKLLGETLDDAAGEAYDKVAKMLGLGFPGGPIIDKLAREGNPEYIRFPRSLLGNENFDFSFSGIKTSVLYWLRDNGFRSNDSTQRLPDQQLKDICASFQAAVVDVLVEKTFDAAARFGIKEIAVAGGVSANSELRYRMRQRTDEGRYHVYFPKLEYCTDNAAMIALVGWMKLRTGFVSDLALTPVANLSL
ncbi:MAG: tRNA (adenosine(37)-N6)-threonylcarbamoyltransferase complex transferase subunit TsaD [Ignavibacteriae bacterium]|nr:tRNA (adenosine(37)-N6)-threonylcarbamoyltransferase complex transferase subunit TsaD [Ignavibacteria bacterium]MBI3363982.1 tRNA (adenosine(37)-N6)-threonylcarbamoyltransferase complex transferase subunit TsaD [Ignavibacteriota bacterium]